MAFEAAERGTPLVLYAVTIFLSAFLLFEVEPIIAKIVLPWFGGSAAVWTTCLLFFQAVLLLGYLYAHVVVRRLEPRTQALLHIALLGVSLLVLPVIPSPSWKPLGSEDPSWRILGLLAVTLGLPYMLISATSPMVQAWYARTHERAVPYRLFALSNAGSMLALLSYPVVVEPVLSTRRQAWAWSAAYLGFVVLCGAVAWMSRGVSRVMSHGRAVRCTDRPAPVTEFAMALHSSRRAESRMTTPSVPRGRHRPTGGILTASHVEASC